MFQYYTFLQRAQWDFGSAAQVQCWLHGTQEADAGDGASPAPTPSGADGQTALRFQVLQKLFFFFYSSLYFYCRVIGLVLCAVLNITARVYYCDRISLNPGNGFILVRQRYIYRRVVLPWVPSVVVLAWPCADQIYICTTPLSALPRLVHYVFFSC